MSVGESSESLELEARFLITKGQRDLRGTGESRRRRPTGKAALLCNQPALFVGAAGGAVGTRSQGAGGKTRPCSRRVLFHNSVPAPLDRRLKMPCCEKPTVFKCCGIGCPTCFASCMKLEVGEGCPASFNMCTGECDCCNKKCKMYPCVTIEWEDDKVAPQSMTR